MRRRRLRYGMRLARPQLQPAPDAMRHFSSYAEVGEGGSLLCDRLLQVGLRTITPHHREQMARFDVRALEARHVGTTDPAMWLAEHLPRNADVYVSFDLDVLDPAFAPGVSHHEPGGISTREALGVLQALDGCRGIRLAEAGVSPGADGRAQ